MALNLNIYQQQIQVPLQRLHEIVTNQAILAVPVGTADAQRDVAIASMLLDRVTAQRVIIQGYLNEIRDIIHNWEETIATLARQARNAADAEFTQFCNANNVMNIRLNGQTRLDALIDRIAEFNIHIAIRRYDIPAGAAPPPPAPVVAAPHALSNLSRLEIPHFTGDKKSDWFEWFGHFKASVGDEPRYTPLQKFAHLKSLVKDQAAEVIAGITLSDANYQIALDALALQYGNKELYKLNLIEELNNLPQCKNFREVMQFRITVDRICRLITNADPTNHDVEVPMVVVLLESKLTIPLARLTAAHLANPMGAPAWTTTQFRAHLGTLINRKAIINGMHNNGNNYVKNHPPSTEHVDNIVTSFPLLSGGEGNSASPPSVSVEGRSKKSELNSAALIHPNYKRKGV